MYKKLGDIILLHMCKIYEDMIYSSWDIRHNRQFFVILCHFLPFDPINNPKHQNLEKMKKNMEISSFYKSVPKIMIICYTVPEMWCVTDVIISPQPNNRQSSASHCPYLSCNDHCDRWVFQEIFILFPRNSFEQSSEFKHFYKTHRTSLFSFYLFIFYLLFCNNSVC